MAAPLLKLTAAQAKLVHLAAQGLLEPPRRAATKAAVAAAIKRMGVLQIDTIHVVARSPYLVLFSRLGPYRERWLDDLLRAGRIFECWAHEACFAPMADFALHHRHQVDRAGHWSSRRARHTLTHHRGAMDALLERIRERGAVKASDFEAPRPSRGGWWSWKNEKRWLEAWFALGELMIARRESFQRVYDLRERVLANAGRTFERAELPAIETAGRELLAAAVRALGVTEARFVPDYFRTERRRSAAELESLTDEGRLVRVAVEGWASPGYAHVESAALLRRATRGELVATHTTLLSPFDPLVWDRARARAFFGFDYRLECYVPAPKRRWGYFVLPILRRGRLVGRVDAKAHRGDGVFELVSVYLEAGVEPTRALVRDVATAIQTCAEWHGTPRVVVRKTQPRALAAALRAEL